MVAARRPQPPGEISLVPAVPMPVKPFQDVAPELRVEHDLPCKAFPVEQVDFQEHPNKFFEFQIGEIRC